MRRKLILGVALVVVLTAAAGTYAWAGASATTTQTLNACVNDDGSMRLVAVAGACRKNEHPVSWNTVGQQGAQGAAGPQGVAGPTGPAGVNPPDPDNVAGTAAITGQKQGDLPAIQVTGFSHEIVSPRDAASGLATGKRIHKPITISKTIDASTPLLLNALADNENLSKLKLTLQMGGNAVETVELLNASVSDYQAQGANETWSFTYQKITWTWLATGTTASDDWEAPTS
jgi:type VI secretion system secreted protein Hcp